MKAILIIIDEYKEDTSKNKEELESLALANDLEVTKSLVVRLDKINPATYIGTGKIQEIVQMIKDEELIIFNNELSPLQIRNLTDLIPIEVTDRTDLILKIFASRAKTKEAKLQVEIAKDTYLLPRLAGMREEITHQQGGAGFRGKGEKQIELDRRVIARKLSKSKKELEKIVSSRRVQRKRRTSNDIPVIAIVGYTNSGKSTLLNSLIVNQEKKVLQKDMLFATLETSSRETLIYNHPCIITDTVGFVDKLPHSLIDAFKSTLEEIKEADLLLHVVDYSNDNYDKQIEITNQVLKEIGVEDKEMIYVFNKVDLTTKRVIHKGNYVYLSAKNNIGYDDLLNKISKVLFKDYKIYNLIIPYENDYILNYLQQNTRVLELQYLDETINIKVECNKQTISKYVSYIGEV